MFQLLVSVHYCWTLLSDKPKTRVGVKALHSNMCHAGVVGTFHPFSPLAAALVAPTQLWVTIAAKLNYDIVKLNTHGKPGDGKAE